MTNINDSNIRDLVDAYINDRQELPADLRNIQIGEWDVSDVTDMSGLFEGTNFNEPLNNWNVSNVTDMASMFSECPNFNQPLNNWNVSNVTNMPGMFLLATSFNQPLNNWNVSNVTDMSEMFNGAEMFNQSLDNWNVRESRVELYNMFKDSLTRTPVPHWYNREREENNGENDYEEEEEEEEDEEELADTRQTQIELQRQAQERVRQAAEQAAAQSPRETQNYPECPICGDYLNNSDGPEQSDKCTLNCKDVVNVCRNNHLLHRGCV